jgi:hypothetical protein
MVAHVCMESELNEAQLRAWNRSRLTRDVATLSMTVRRLTERTKRSEAIRERLSRLGMGKDVEYIKA